MFADNYQSRSSRNCLPTSVITPTRHHDRIRPEHLMQVVRTNHFERRKLVVVLAEQGTSGKNRFYSEFIHEDAGSGSEFIKERADAAHRCHMPVFAASAQGEYHCLAEFPMGCCPCHRSDAKTGWDGHQLDKLR